MKNFLIKASVISLLAVDLILNVVTMWILAPDPVSRVGFVAIGIVIVSLGLPSWLRKKIALWAIFASVSVFLNLSFTLEATRVQSGDNPEIQRIETRIIQLDAMIDDYNNQYYEATKRETMDQIDESRTRAQDERADLAGRRLDPQGASMQMKSEDVFQAIPRAISDFRFIPIIFFGLIFIGMQRAIVVFSSGGNVTFRKKKPEPKPAPKKKRRKPATRPRPARDYIRQWVESNYIGLKNNRSTKIISKESFDQFWSARGGFPVAEYKRIKQAAIDNGVIDSDDEIIEINQEKAIDTIRNINNNKAKEIV